MILILTCKECSGYEFEQIPNTEVYECLDCGCPNALGDLMPAQVETKEEL